MEETNKDECPVCFNDLDDYIQFACLAGHKICFKCMLEILSKSNGHNCVYCRGGDDNIVIHHKKFNDDINDEHSLKYFLSCIYYLEHISKTKLENTSIIHINILKYYLLNIDNFKQAKQIELIPTEKSEILNMIDWKTNIIVSKRNTSVAINNDDSRVMDNDNRSNAYSYYTPSIYNYGIIGSTEYRVSTPSEMMNRYNNLLNEYGLVNRSNNINESNNIDADDTYQ